MHFPSLLDALEAHALAVRPRSLNTGRVERFA